MEWQLSELEALPIDLGDLAMAQFEVMIGKAFEVSAVEVDDVGDVSRLVEGVNSHSTSRVRGHVTYLIAVAALLSLLISFFVGWEDGSYDELTAVWSAIALPLGYVLRTYFVSVE